MSDKENKNPEYVVFDAEGKILGRLATEIARVLSGKDKIDFKPNVGGSAWAIVVNSDKVRLSGAKAKNKIYHKHSGYPGGITSISFDDLVRKDSTKVIELAVKGMLPKNKLSRVAMKRLRVFKGPNHDFERYINKSEKESK
jgi:large subunit ribosomal protein L13